MPRNLHLRTTFDAIAQDYDELRPRYPEPLIEDVVSRSGIAPGGRILEIGCGPGTATLPFARRGYTMLCLELGPNMAKLAAAKCSPYPGVEIQTTAFENWPLQPQAFDLVLSASAFHWIPTEMGYTKSAAALKEGGTLALSWIRHLAADTPFFRAMKAYWEDNAPQLAAESRKPPPGELEKLTVADLDASGLFGPVEVRRYGWTRTYSAEQYARLLGTYSPVQNLEETRRRELLGGVRDLAERHGGLIERPYEALLYLADLRYPLLRGEKRSIR